MNLQRLTDADLQSKIRYWHDRIAAREAKSVPPPLAWLEHSQRLVDESKARRAEAVLGSYSRWVLQGQSPSGKQLFRCTKCDRITISFDSGPDDVCPTGCRDDEAPSPADR